jgi:hypothetical protein
MRFAGSGMHHRHWGGYRRFGYGYGAYASYASDCYWVPRYGYLVKVCY